MSKKTHHVLLSTHPEAAPHLAALYTATAAGTTAISGRDARAAREKLAALVGGPVAEILRAGGPIRVRPKNAGAWIVQDDAGDPYADYALSRVIREEMARQGLSGRKVAESAGSSQRTIYHLTTAQGSPTWRVVLGALRALGKDIHWLADQLSTAK